MKKGGEYVDSGSKLWDKKVNSQDGLHGGNVHHFHDARGKFVSSIESAIDYIKKEGIQGTAQTAVGLVANALEEAKQLPAYLGKESQVRLAVVSKEVCVNISRQWRCATLRIPLLRPVRAYAGSDAPPGRSVRQAENLPRW